MLTGPRNDKRSLGESAIVCGAAIPKVGFVKNSPEHEVVKKWRTERYHAPSDDLAQPINRQAAEDFGKVYLALVQAVANRPTRPQWNGDSFFRRFAR